ncbi:MAG: hypothetical protein RLY78_3014 [Pseudomonadota bacterium]
MRTILNNERRRGLAQAGPVAAAIPDGDRVTADRPSCVVRFVPAPSPLLVCPSMSHRDHPLISRTFALTPLAAALLCLSVSSVQAAGETTLDALVVTASGHGQTIQDAPATMTVITAKEIAGKSYTDLADVLKTVPGVTVLGTGTEQSISIRGMGNTYTLFLIDGRPAQGGDTFEFNGGGKGQQIAFMPPLEMIERIEVIRGPASSLYGSDAMGGVVNIITKKVADRVSGSVTAELVRPDSRNQVNGDAYNTSFMLNAPLVKDTLGLQLSGGSRSTDEGSQVQFGDATTADADYQNNSLGAKLSWKQDARNTWVLGGARTETKSRRNPGASLAAGTAATFAGSTKANLSLAHEGRYGDLQTSSYINHDDASNPTTRTNAPSGTARGIAFTTLAANTQATWSAHERHTLTGGLNYKHETLKDGATSAVNVYNQANDAYVEMDRYQASVFAEDEWRLRQDLAMTLSMRYDHNQQYGGHVSPKAYLVYQPRQGLAIKGGVLTGYKAPSLRQSAPDFSATSMGGVTVGNPDLRPETSTTVELGVDYESRPRGLKTSLTVYRSDFDDKITRDAAFLCLPNVECTYNGKVYPAHVYGYKEIINVDKARIHGLEFTLDQAITRQLQLRTNYTLTDSEQLTGTSKGAPLSDEPRHKLNMSLNYEASPSLSLWTQAAYVSEFISADVAGSTTTSQSYALLDLGLSWRPSRTVAMKFGVYNASNRKVANSSNGYVDGRRYSVAATYAF